MDSQKANVDYSLWNKFIGQSHPGMVIFFFLALTFQILDMNMDSNRYPSVLLPEQRPGVW
jgi:hypothetical protein